MSKWMNDWDVAEQFLNLNTADIWSQIIGLGPVLGFVECLAASLASNQ